KPPKHFNKNISDEFNNIIFKAMSLNREERYQSVEEMKSELDRIYAKLKPQGKIYETNVLEEDEPEEVKKEIKSQKPEHPSYVKLLSPKFYVLPLLILFILLLCLLFSRNNNSFVITCNVDDRDDAVKLSSLLKSKGYEGKISVNENPRIILEEGYRIAGRFEKRKAVEEIPEVSAYLQEKGKKFLLYNLKNEGKMLVISENFKNKKEAERMFKELNIKGLNVEPCGFFIGKKPSYSVTVLIKKTGDGKNILDFLVSKGYNPEKGYYNTE
ncbi:MAG: hypothetical protein ABRQ39_31740, partial [Candidatus Eremiobacterota bacterium]